MMKSYKEVTEMAKRRKRFKLRRVAPGNYKANVIIFWDGVPKKSYIDVWQGITKDHWGYNISVDGEAFEFQTESSGVPTYKKLVELLEAIFRYGLIYHNGWGLDTDKWKKKEELQ